jgi:hypothetical protein
MLNRHRALGLWWSTIPRVKPEGMLFEKPLSTFPDHALDLWWSMIFPENRYPLFRIML